RDGWRGAIPLAARATLVPVVAVGLAAAQLAPSQELRALTGRADIGYDASIAYSLPPAQLLSLAIPDLFGRGPGSYWGPWPRVEMGYFGVLPLVAAIAAAVLRRQAAVWFLAGVAVVAVILAMGGYTVVHGWVYRFVPGFEGIRAPARALVLFNLVMAWLAAIGVDSVMRASDPLARQAVARFVRWGGFALLGLIVGALPPFVFFLALAQGQRGPVPLRLTAILDGLLLFAFLLGGAILLVGLRAHGRLSARAFGVLAVVWVAFDLLSIGFDVDGGSIDPLANYQHPAVVAFLRQDPDPAFRIDTDTGVWKHWQPAAGLYHRLADVRGVDNPLMLADTQRYWAHLGGRNGVPYDLLNVRYVLGPPEAVFEPAKFERVLADGPVVVYRNRHALPRVWLAPDAEIAPSHEAAFAAVHRAGFDPRRTVILERGPAQRGGSGDVAIVERHSDRLTVRAQAPQGGYLVLSETWYPGWEASVNGQPAQPTLRANYLFQAVWVPPGESTVTIRYAPTIVYAGMAISGLTLVAVISVVTALALRDRRARSPAASTSGAPRRAHALG
ncbi:MAG: YfhO family protein, partial [Dehalococcoidia bacterium]|nr:YfhO family protein [Dehalococcoidia bacterium]